MKVPNGTLKIDLYFLYRCFLDGLLHRLYILFSRPALGQLLWTECRLCVLQCHKEADSDIRNKYAARQWYGLHLTHRGSASSRAGFNLSLMNDTVRYIGYTIRSITVSELHHLLSILLLSKLRDSCHLIVI